jgi:5-formyltetrahydrofolate cyclo-ligase
MACFGLRFALPKTCGVEGAVKDNSDISALPFTKKTLRKHLLTQRKAFTPEDWQIKSDAICQNLAQFEWVQKAQTILVYLSHRQEPNLAHLWTHDFAHKRWGIPRCVEKSLIWHEWQPAQAQQIRLGAYGILEPISTLPVIDANAVDLILVPAVGCDRQGFRLGYGGGFYDRLLSDPAWANIPTIGIVFEFAYLDRLTPDPWDYPLRAVCTEIGIKHCD